MKLRILAVGRLKEACSRDAAEDYLGRVLRYLPCEVVEVKDAGGEGEETKILATEARRLREAAPDGAFRVALDVRGKSYSSVEFARFLGDRMSHGGGDLAFLIGGPWGLEPGLRRECDLQLSLSALTFPHDLVRVILLEQIYRALTILRGEPYHK
ncbi:MAG TPA: 23S rRNA (pseudouridine(1915)-N(3))-methyltransferase RlmH [Gemmatimonadota bacterium]